VHKEAHSETHVRVSFTSHLSISFMMSIRKVSFPRELVAYMNRRVPAVNEYLPESLMQCEHVVGVTQRLYFLENNPDTFGSIYNDDNNLLH
jgi:hypothetical protein